MASRHAGNLRPDGIVPARSVTELLQWDGEAFVRRAYLELLGRPADTGGLAFYMQRMADGKTKISILKQLRRSGEGRAYGAQVPGLDRAIRQAMLKRAPVIGPVYRWLLGAQKAR